MSSQRSRGRRFDAQANVVTESLVFLGELDPDAIGDALEDATHYEPTPPGDIEALLDALPEPPRGFTFVDAGAGMGRVVLLASKRAFKQIVGIEVSPALCEVAQDNVVRWFGQQDGIACRDVRIVCGNALHARLPRGPAVVYLFNPFGERTMAAFARRLREECSPATYVVYHTPVHRHVFDEDRRFEPVAQMACGVLYRKR